jgi:hypothetical protein
VRKYFFNLLLLVPNIISAAQLKVPGVTTPSSAADMPVVKSYPQLSTQAPSIKLLYSAALIEHQAKQREEEYRQCAKSLESYGFKDPYIVEAIKGKESTTFLNTLSKHVFYSTVNDSSVINKGVNEGRTMLQALDHFSFDPNDMVLKITGRYPMEIDAFSQRIKNNPDIDAIVKTDKIGRTYTACFALREKYLRDMLTSINYKGMIQDKTLEIENEFETYLKKMAAKGMQILYINNLGIFAREYSTGENNSRIIKL